MDHNHFLCQLVSSSFNENFQMGHLGTLECNLQTFPSELPNLPQTSPKSAPSKPPHQKLSCSKNNTQICNYSTLKNYPKHLIIHTQNRPYLCPQKSCSKTQKIDPKTSPKFALTLPNSRCQENSCKVAYQGRNKET